MHNPNVMICIEKVFDTTSFDHELKEFLKKVNVKFLIILYLIARVHNLLFMKIRKCGMLVKGSIDFDNKMSLVFFLQNL